MLHIHGHKCVYQVINTQELCMDACFAVATPRVPHATHLPPYKSFSRSTLSVRHSLWALQKYQHMSGAQDLSSKAVAAR